MDLGKPETPTHVAALHSRITGEVLGTRAMEDLEGLRMQAAQWRKAAKNHDGAAGQALLLAAEILEGKALQIEAAGRRTHPEPANDRKPPASAIGGSISRSA